MRLEYPYSLISRTSLKKANKALVPAKLRRLSRRFRQSLRLVTYRIPREGLPLLRIAAVDSAYTPQRTATGIKMSGMRPFATCAYLASLGLAFAQPAPDGPRFEVASIKATDPNPSNPMFIGMSADGAMVKYTNITLRDCIRGAYRVRDFPDRRAQLDDERAFRDRRQASRGARPRTRFPRCCKRCWWKGSSWRSGAK